MIIFKDKFTGDELLSDSIPGIKSTCNHMIWELQSKRIAESKDVNVNTGANASVEGEDAQELEDGGVVMDYEVVIYHKLKKCELFPEKKIFVSHMKKYVKKIMEKLEKDQPDRVNDFKNGAKEVFATLVSKFKDLDFYTGETDDEVAGMLVCLEFREVDGEELPFFWFWKDGIIDEKV